MDVDSPRKESGHTEVAIAGCKLCLGSWSEVPEVPHCHAGSMFGAVSMFATRDVGLKNLSCDASMNPVPMNIMLLYRGAILMSQILMFKGAGLCRCTQIVRGVDLCHCTSMVRGAGLCYCTLIVGGIGLRRCTLMIKGSSLCHCTLITGGGLNNSTRLD